jgi:hypothetical protein
MATYSNCLYTSVTKATTRQDLYLQQELLLLLIFFCISVTTHSRPRRPNLDRESMKLPMLGIKQKQTRSITTSRITRFSVLVASIMKTKAEG